MIQPLIISPPMGDIISHPGATGVTRTYTYKYRAGRWWRRWKMLSTIRYYPGIQAWKNKLGLPNEGLGWFKTRCRALRGGYAHEMPERFYVCDRILSIKGDTADEWQRLLSMADSIPNIAGIELNVSCPNVASEDLDLNTVFDYATTNISLPVWVKVPPVDWWYLTQAAYEAGITRFHCCNTLPTPGGGLSGKPLQKLSLWCVEDLRKRFKDDIQIIGGGGVVEPADVCRFANAGANHVSVSSGLFNPLRRSRRLSRLAAAAKEWLPQKGVQDVHPVTSDS